MKEIELSLAEIILINLFTYGIYLLALRLGGVIKWRSWFGFRYFALRLIALPALVGSFFDSVFFFFLFEVNSFTLLFTSAIHVVIFAWIIIPLFFPEEWKEWRDNTGIYRFLKTLLGKK